MNPRLSEEERAVAQEIPVIADDLPILYEDEGQENMGETRPHSMSLRILELGMEDHLSDRTDHTVVHDMNLYYHPRDLGAYVSPDLMVVVTDPPLPQGQTSYRIGEHGPAPILVVEALSRRSFQQQDLTNKPVIYSRLGVREYVLVDVTGQFLPQRLELRKLQDDRTWQVLRDPDGGVTSELGFRIIFDESDQLLAVNVESGEPYLRHEDLREDRELARKILQEQQEELQLKEEQLREQQEMIDKLKAQLAQQSRDTEES